MLSSSKFTPNQAEYGTQKSLKDHSKWRKIWQNPFSHGKNFGVPFFNIFHWADSDSEVNFCLIFLVHLIQHWLTLIVHDCRINISLNHNLGHHGGQSTATVKLSSLHWEVPTHLDTGVRLFHIHWTKANVFVFMKTEKIFNVSSQFLSGNFTENILNLSLFYTKSAKYSEMF